MPCLGEGVITVMTYGLSLFDFLLSGLHAGEWRTRTQDDARPDTLEVSPINQIQQYGTHVRNSVLNKRKPLMSERAIPLGAECFDPFPCLGHSGSLVWPPWGGTQYR